MHIMDIIPYIHVTDFVRLMRTTDLVYNGQNLMVHLNPLYASFTVFCCLQSLVFESCHKGFINFTEP